ncbi:unnamed protein product [Rhodiola kirilowii]
MKAPSLLVQCLPGFGLHNKGSQGALSVYDTDLHLLSPAVEIVPPKTAHPFKYAGDLQGSNLFKGRVSVADLIASTKSDFLDQKHDAFSKSCESAFDLIKVLKHEIRDGQLSFRGKQVLELGCSYGSPGTFACIKGAYVVHFQDTNAETIRCTTIPNVILNLEQARDSLSRQPESPLTPSRQMLAPKVHFYAGEWDELPNVLSIVKEETFEVPALNLSFSEEDFMDGYSSQDGSIIGHESSSRRSRKYSRSKACESANETHKGEGGYDIILMTAVPYSTTSLKKLYALLKKCLKPPYGVLYLATKKHYVGFSNGSARQLKSLVEEEGVLGAHMVKELHDREIWKFFFK